MTDRSMLDALDAMIATFARRDDPAAPSDGTARTVKTASTAPTEETYGDSYESDSTDSTHIDGTLSRVVSLGRTVQTVRTGFAVPRFSDAVEYFWRLEFGELPHKSSGFAELGSARECFWHLDHGERVPPDLCAGCRRPIGPGEAALELADGNRVQLADGYDCLIQHGERWRRAARAAVGQTAGAVSFSPATPTL